MGISLERRQHLREAASTELRIEWTDGYAVTHSLVGATHNVSEAGLSGVFADAVEAGQLVSVSFPELGIAGTGVVRHSTPSEGGFVVGMALVGDLQSS